MVELERNPFALRQGAAAVACIAAAAIAMPVISHRASEQRDSADWAARAMAFQAEMRGQSTAQGEPAARIELISMRTPGGVRARGAGTVAGPEGLDRRALMVQAALRGPLSAPEAQGPVQELTIDPRQLRCLSEAVYYEARGESYRGQVAVGEVVMNRVRSRHYPNSICGVVYQGSTRATGCQFTFTCDGSLNKRPRGRAWERAQHIARQVMMGYTRPVTRSATHYHTTAVNPYWSGGLVETTRVGTHIFYRFPNRSERAVLMAAMARRAPRASAADASLDDVLPIDEAVAEEALVEEADLEAAAPVLQPAVAQAAQAPAAQPAVAPAQPGARAAGVLPASDAPVAAAPARVEPARANDSIAAPPPAQHLGASARPSAP